MQQGLLQQFHQLPLLERAARCAVGCWFNIEQGLCNAVQGAEGPNQIFPTGWFKYWGVARTFRRKGNRQEICQLLLDTRPQLMTALPNTLRWGLVQQLSAQIKPINCDIRPTSLVSKFAFSCSPVTFTPYDRIVRGQFGTSPHDYLAYRNAFAQQQVNIEQQLGAFTRPGGQVGLAAQDLPLNGNVMNQQLFVVRTTDWYLLLQGRFDPIAAKNPVYDRPII